VLGSAWQVVTYYTSNSSTMQWPGVKNQWLFLSCSETSAFVTLSAAKSLGATSEILRFAQDDSFCDTRIPPRRYGILAMTPKRTLTGPCWPQANIDKCLFMWYSAISINYTREVQ